MKTIAVFFGGRSAEHDVSIITALATVIKPLELTKKYRVEAVYIAKNGAWFWSDKLKDIKLFTSGEIDRFMSRTTPASIQFDGGMVLCRPAGLGKLQRLKVDVAFPAMHGTYGEDGALMGLLDMAGVPYAGCDMPASVLAMDKVLAKQTVAANGILTPKFKHYTRTAVDADTAAVAKDASTSLSFPLFIKPAHLGSSIGISMAKNVTELRNGLEVAARYDDTIVVEEGVQNLIEVTLPVIGNGDDVTPAYLEQPMVKADDFFDFETKYMGQGGKKGGSKQGSKQGAQGYSTIPAALDEKLYATAEATGLAAYKALGCNGMARIDMLIDTKSKKVYFNEANPLPGSLYAHNWRQKGVSNVSLVTRMVELGEAHFAERQKQNTVFDTNFLKQF